MTKSKIPPKAGKLLILVVLLLVSAPVFAQSVDTAWVRRYNGPNSWEDAAYAIALDLYGNICVTGQINNNGASPSITSDYGTIKYYPNGDTAWVRTYNGPRNCGDAAYSISIDGFGNVYVTGERDQNGFVPYTCDYATLKYSVDGTELWIKEYNGSANNYDAAYAIALDGFGNAYVAGRSDGDTTSSDYATIKYDEFGNQLWVRRYNGLTNGADVATAVAVDDSGNICVTGWSWGNVTEHDYITVKYDPNGSELWSKRYNGPGNSRDDAVAIAVDASCNIYVTGSSWDNITYYDFATIKYYPNGDTAWVRRYNGPVDRDDIPRAIVADIYGNTYVTGGSTGQGTNFDYATIKYYSNGDTAWVRRYNHPVGSADIALAISIDNYGNVYVTGDCFIGGSPWYNHDYVTIKYDSSGNRLWTYGYNGPANGYDVARAIAVDDSGNVYVTGRSDGDGTDGDYATIKYVQFLCGDVNKDGVVNVTDVVYLINYLFISGPAPVPILHVGDVNQDEVVNVTDVVYLINYLFLIPPGPPPCS